MRVNSTILTNSHETQNGLCSLQICIIRYTYTADLLHLTTLSLNQSLSLVVQVQLGDDNLGRVNVDGDRSTGRLLDLQLLNLHRELQSVDSGDLALGALLGASDDGDLVLLSDRNGLDVVLLSQLLGQRSRHQHSSLGGGGAEVSLSRLRTRRRNVWMLVFWRKSGADLGKIVIGDLMNVFL